MFLAFIDDICCVFTKEVVTVSLFSFCVEFVIHVLQNDMCLYVLQKEVFLADVVKVVVES